ncbi:AMP-dependent synthetase/ligase [Reinekea marinisedimentorum]|uniref:Long-chain acyl-CoA synthetase n=1 Tax=Reinekea marinisedimentorum TaxID=230495 RepID=A0A4R3I579_9GAMM|nr:long-chain fatty acid--CoA ligase [Reinekea marinisedimentorum]TCS41112.1 long-chain acyl-CoA synthetase [Reinekea marinisedimentorum]
MPYISQMQHHAATYPSALALSEKQQGHWHHLSWTEAWQQVTQIAARLNSLGISRGERIAIFANNCVDWTLVDLAAMYLGVVTVPLYATASPGQIQYILQHAKVRLAFCGEEQSHTLASVTDELPDLTGTVLIGQHSLSSLPDNHLQHWVGTNLPAPEPYLATESDLLTIVYTSGTTGTPKGVMLTHGNLMATVQSHLQALDFSRGDRSLAALPLSHIFERGWSLIALYAGGHNHYVDDVKQMASLLPEVKPHVVCAVPRMLEKIHSGIFSKAKKKGFLAHFMVNWADVRVQRNTAQQLAGKELNGYQRRMQALATKLVGSKIRNALGGEVRFMPCGGGSLDAGIHSFFAGLGINVKVGYGLTETFGTVSLMPDVGYLPGSMGQQLPNVETRIDPKTQEILVKSPGMTHGYYLDEAATSELLVDGWLRTGDAGNKDAQGNLIFQERIKDLMKTANGKYIAPQQVEGILAREALFEQVAVIADARKFVSALIVPAWEALEDYAQSINLSYENRLELIRNSKVLEYVEHCLQEVQGELAMFEQVKKFTLLPQEFSIEQGEITPTMKLRRNVIAQRFAQEIEAMYS